MLNKYFRIIKEIFVFTPIYLISCLIPRNNYIWIFGSWFGDKFADNSKYLYLYVATNQSAIRPIWLTKNENVLNELKKYGYECYNSYSLKGFYYSMRAGLIIVCQGTIDVNRFVLGCAKKIQLWHGTPLKKIHFDTLSPDSFPYLRSICCLVLDAINPFFQEKFDLYIASSLEVTKKICTAFNTTNERVVITGYPRNDALSNSQFPEIPEICSNLHNFVDECNIIITYLPTFRDNGLTFDQLFTNFGFDIDKANKFLEKHEAIFICKPHSVDVSTMMNSLASKRFRVLSDSELPDIYSLLKVTDILITDYSSVYFDYLIMNKPIIFSPFDFDEYLDKSRELYYDYYSVTPGPKATNWDEVFHFMEKEILNPYLYSSERKQMNLIFNTYTDNKNSERVFQKIVELIKLKF